MLRGALFERRQRVGILRQREGVCKLVKHHVRQITVVNRRSRAALAGAIKTLNSSPSASLAAIPDHQIMRRSPRHVARCAGHHAAGGLLNVRRGHCQRVAKQTDERRAWKRCFEHVNFKNVAHRACGEQAVLHGNVLEPPLAKRLKVARRLAHSAAAVNHCRISGKLAASVNPRHVRIGTPRLRCVEKCSRNQLPSPR